MKKYLLYGAVLLTLAVLPSLHVIPSLKVYDEKRVFQLCLLILGSLLFISELFTNSKQASLEHRILHPYRMNNTLRWGIVCFGTLGLLSAWANGGLFYGLQELALYLLLFIFFMYAAGLYQQQPKQFNNALGWLLLCLGGLYTLKFMIGYGMHLAIDYPLWPGKPYQRHFFGFANPRFFNQIQVWTLPLFIGWYQKLNTRKPNGLWTYIPPFTFLFFAALWWCFVIQSAGRGALLCLLVAPIVIWGIYRKVSHDYIKKYFYSLLTGLTLKFLLFNVLTNEPSKSLARDTGSAGRLDRWGKMLVDIIDKPLLGYGPMSYAKISERFHAGHPHNSVLQIAYEYGLPAIFIALSLVLWGLCKWFNQKPSNPLAQQNKLLDDEPAIFLGLSTALLAGLGYSLVSGVIVMPLSQLWLALLGGWALGVYFHRNYSFHSSGSDNTYHARLTQWKFGSKMILSSLVLAAALWMGVTIWQDVPQLKENQEAYRKEIGRKFRPRFWQQGKIGIDYSDPVKEHPSNTKQEETVKQKSFYY